MREKGFESYTDGGVKILPITKMIYNQIILTTTQYVDQSPGDKRHNIFVHPVFTCAPTSYVTGCVDQHLDGSSV